MGYSYSVPGNRLCCDNCGGTGSTRKRRCPHKVTSQGVQPLPYCPAPALCAACWAKLGGAAGVHGDRCRDGAKQAQAEDDALVARLDAGEQLVRTAWGDWDPDTPTGMVRVMTWGRGGVEGMYLMPADDYSGGGFIGDYPTAIAVADHDAVVAAWDDLIRT